MSQHMSHKNLKEFGKQLGGYYFNGNIYDHENKVYFLVNAAYNPVDTVLLTKNEEEKFQKLLREVIDLHATRAIDTRLAYSYGIYGNTGQLHKIEYYNEADELIKTIFIYV